MPKTGPVGRSSAKTVLTVYVVKYARVKQEKIQSHLTQRPNVQLAFMYINYR